ncbi:MAG: CPBP family intramembrane glutamic endopeptidase [Halofilum sp. (in: g-proteobacteria)]|nr:CPBP family intramembrane glutamic endopeptidase [Halofilum sp. (in: g-proteobacteria)]
MARIRLPADRPFVVAVVFEAALIPLALLLAVPVGLQPWREFAASPGLLFAAVAATLPLIVALAVFARVGARWFEDVEALVRPLIESVFRGRGIVAVVVVSALAGVGEELLFRGVIQAGVSQGFGAWQGLVVASVLFGLMHALSRAYFVLATLMGLYLGALYQITDNLLLPALVHGLYDAIAIGYLLVGDGGRNEPGQPVS